MCILPIQLLLIPVTYWQRTASAFDLIDLQGDAYSSVHLFLDALSHPVTHQLLPFVCSDFTGLLSLTGT